MLAVLQQSLGGWEALETDLLESANLTHQAAELSSRVRSATQVVVDAVLDLLDAGVFRYLTCCCSCVYCWHIQASALNPCLHNLKPQSNIETYLKQHNSEGVHILVLLLLCISFSKPLGGAAQANKACAHHRLAVCRQSDVIGTDSTAEALLFVRGLLVEGRATAEPQATVKVLRHLAQDPHPASEDSFMAVLQTATLQGLHPFALTTAF